ncbi:hypothetical protein [Faecalibacterium prausnitzii]|uniref:hypothetical protein n=1 Tax=Faecalibacterium prausnitzii TaxID=853 RepID=UPI003DA10D3F
MAWWLNSFQTATDNFYLKHKYWGKLFQRRKPQKAGLGWQPQQVSDRGTNERKAKFGTLVDTCSERPVPLKDRYFLLLMRPFISTTICVACFAHFSGNRFAFSFNSYNTGKDETANQNR